MDDEKESRSAFRATVRAFIAANFPIELRGCDPIQFQTDGALAASNPYFQDWRTRMAGTGWGVPTWPLEYGGAGLDEVAARIIAEEIADAGAFNPIRSYGSTMLGPTLLEFGSPAQKAEHLPPMARNERRWCQGFSEPGAGSDLASLSTRCSWVGDHWLVNGQKIWTSGADHSDWCFALVRTDTSTKHDGISFLLIDMGSPGIEVRPIELISGSTHFCEVFFNDVAVPAANLVGSVNQGWAIAKRLLQFERDSLSVGRGDIPSLAPIAHDVVGTDEKGHIANADLRARLIRNGMRVDALGETIKRLATEAKAGNGPNSGVSAIKNLWSSIMQERAELLIELYGSEGLGWSGDAYPPDAQTGTRAWLHSKAFSIYGGSFEVQNNIVSKRVLNLPDPPRHRDAR